MSYFSSWWHWLQTPMFTLGGTPVSGARMLGLQIIVNNFFSGTVLRLEKTLKEGTLSTSNLASAAMCARPACATHA